MNKITGLILLAAWAPANAKTVRLAHNSFYRGQLPIYGAVRHHQIAKPVVELPEALKGTVVPGAPLAELPWASPNKDDQDGTSGIAVRPIRPHGPKDTMNWAIKALADKMNAQKVNAVFEKSAALQERQPVRLNTVEPVKGKPTPQEPEAKPEELLTPPEWALEEELGRR